MSRHLMARFRHAGGDGLNFDWKPVERSEKRRRAIPGEYEARLENGDHLSVTGRNPGAGHPRGTLSWGYHIHGPFTPRDRIIERVNGVERYLPGHEDKLWMVSPHDPPGTQSEWLAGGGHAAFYINEADISPYKPFRRGGDFYDPHEAMRAAEQHYLDLRRQGQGSTVMDSGVDYDSLLRPAPLDDDFGDIFGEGR